MQIKILYYEVYLPLHVCHPLPFLQYSLLIELCDQLASGAFTFLKALILTSSIKKQLLETLMQSLRNWPLLFCFCLCANIIHVSFSLNLIESLIRLWDVLFAYLDVSVGLRWSSGLRRQFLDRGWGRSWVRIPGSRHSFVESRQFSRNWQEEEGTVQKRAFVSEDAAMIGIRQRNLT